MIKCTLLLYNISVGCCYKVNQSNDIALHGGASVTEAKCKSVFDLAKYTPYLTLVGELWAVYCEDFGENWSHYHSTVLYFFWKCIVNIPIHYLWVA